MSAPDLMSGPISVWVNTRGRATVYGLWNLWPSIGAHPGFRHVKGRPLADLDLTALCAVAEITAVEINEPDAVEPVPIGEGTEPGQLELLTPTALPRGLRPGRPAERLRLAPPLRSRRR